MNCGFNTQNSFYKTCNTFHLSSVVKDIHVYVYDSLRRQCSIKMSLAIFGFRLSLLRFRLKGENKKNTFETFTRTIHVITAKKDTLSAPVCAD